MGISYAERRSWKALSFSAFLIIEIAGLIPGYYTDKMVENIHQTNFKIKN